MNGRKKKYPVSKPSKARRNNPAWFCRLRLNLPKRITTVNRACSSERSVSLSRVCAGKVFAAFSLLIPESVFGSRDLTRLALPTRARRKGELTWETKACPDSWVYKPCRHVTDSDECKAKDTKFASLLQLTNLPVKSKAYSAVLTWSLPNQHGRASTMPSCRSAKEYTATLLCVCYSYKYSKESNYYRVYVPALFVICEG